MKIILDAFGSDFSPRAQVLGAALSLQNVILAGDAQLLEAEILHAKGAGHDVSKLEILHAPDVILPGENPTEAVLKAQSSMVVALNALKEGRGEALVSAGNTGALLMGAYKIVGRLGRSRPCIAAVAPTLPGGRVVYLDAGANSDARPEHLLEFARAGTDYAKTAFGLAAPRVGLLSNGTEDEKGSELIKAAHALLRAAESINFVGNLEARDILSGACDVMVTDGFTGNVALKACEGMADNIFEVLKRGIKAGGLRAKIGYLLLKPQFKALKKALDLKAIGGAVLLGIAKPVIKAHGSSNENHICAAILQARQAESV